MDLVSVICLVSLLGCAGGKSAKTQECTFTSQCPANHRCVEQRCVLFFSDGGTCPNGQVFVDGQCQVDENRCRMDADCPNGRCVDGQCFANQCTDDDERPCDGICGGTQTCRGGIWRPCPAPTTEICGDGKDNDCDNETDEQCQGCADGTRRDCMTECGVGQEICTNGQWGFCSAPRPHPETCGNMTDDNCDGTVDEGCDNCETGQTRPCGNEQCSGEETCTDRTWGGCTAPQPSDEICDGQDNDCDGAVDEETVRNCDNACGAGLESCNEAAWSGCTAPDTCACVDSEGIDSQVCGICGVRQRECQNGTWAPWGACDEAMAQCVPGEEEQGMCGQCGNHSRRCTPECRWGDWQPCGDEGVCSPGSTQPSSNAECINLQSQCSDKCEWITDCSQAGPTACPAPGAMETEACGQCGVRTRLCTECCGWAEWSQCEDEGVCAPNEEDAMACGGNCAVQLRTCTAQCQWGEYGECSDSGQCMPGQSEEEVCGFCGTRTRDCSDECIWNAWDDCNGSGGCAPGNIEERRCGSGEGQCTPGVETRTCNAQCGWNDFGPCRDEQGPQDEICGNGLDEDCDGEDLVRPDDYDRDALNNSCATCTYLNGVRDGNYIPDIDNLEYLATIDRVDDVDYYCVVADDGFSVIGFTEHFRVDLENIPQGQDYDLYLYKSIADCEDRNSLARSINSNNADDNIDWGEDLISDDGGTYVIRVDGVGRSHSCFGSYLLRVDGLR
jgi:hypothetical protein